MARPGFYVDNANRFYPFLKDWVSGIEDIAVDVGDLADLPKSFIVDLGFLMGVQSGFVVGRDRVYLAGISRSGSQVFFQFRCTSPTLTYWSLTFTRTLTSADYESEYADAQLDAGASLSLSSSVSIQCAGDAIWSGYLITSNAAEFADYIADGEIKTGQAFIEPALIQNASRAYARSINLGNADRTRATNPDGCRELCWPFELQSLYVRETCVVGPIRFKEGYNASIRQSAIENSLTISAQVGGGEGEPCDEVPVFDNEEPPTHGSLFSGGPGCHEVIRSINGIGGSVVNVLGGPGVTVAPEPNNHRVIIDVDTNSLAVCFLDDSAEVSESSCSDLPPSLDDCDCGPAE